tara:strand:- start:95582 stop:95917 length:336 start_codon:yes stop_codon:yes gene_type:complete
MSKIKHVLLLPLNYNDGSTVPSDVLDQIFTELFVLAGGYYVAGEGDGAYLMKDGTKQVDRLLAVWVAVDENDIPELKRLAGKFATKLDQETIYLERSGSTVDFIPPLILKG